MATEKTIRTADARALVKALERAGLSMTMANGRRFGHTQALDVLAQLEGFNAHSHKQAVASKAAPAASVATQNEATIAYNSFMRILREWLNNNGEHSLLPRSDWEYLVANGDTSLGYADWLASEFESRYEELVSEMPLPEYTTTFLMQAFDEFKSTSFSRHTAPRIRVTTPGKESAWNIEPNLSTREGTFNYAMFSSKPDMVSLLMAAPEDVALMQDSMANEMCFIAGRFGEIGLLVEMELCTQRTEIPHYESPQDMTKNGIFPEEPYMSNVRKTMLELAPPSEFSNVEFALANYDDYSAAERHAVWAFVPLKELKSKTNAMAFMTALTDYVWATFDAVRP